MAAKGVTATYSRPAGRLRRKQLLGLQRAGHSAWARRHDPRLQVQATLAVLFAAAIAAFAHIVEDYLTGDPLVRWDVEFSRWLHLHSSAAFVSVFKIVTIGGTVAFLALFVLSVALYFLRRGRFDEAALLCAGALGIEVLNALLKLVFHRPRPQLSYVHLDTYSFPSGHAAGSAAIYAVALYLLVRGASRRWRVICAIVYVVLVVLIGFSRLYLEAHYLSDVLAGLSLGAAWALACLFAYETRHDFVGRLFPVRWRTLAERVARSRA